MIFSRIPLGSCSVGLMNSWQRNVAGLSSTALENFEVNGEPTSCVSSSTFHSLSRQTRIDE